MICAIAPERAAYTAQASAPVLSTQLDGGLPRLRATALGVSSPVSCQWSTDPSGYNYLMAFYRLTMAAPFQIQLLLDTADLQLYTVTIEPKTFRLISQAGLTYTVGATLNVAPLPQDPTNDAAIVSAYGTYGQSTGDFFDLLSTFVNTNIPAAI